MTRITDIENIELKQMISEMINEKTQPIKPSPQIVNHILRVLLLNQQTFTQDKVILEKVILKYIILLNAIRKISHLPLLIQAGENTEKDK